jgi:hypothetical protein
MYEGGWYRDDYHGHGRFTFRNGDVYEGEWRNGSRQGKGRIIHSDGTVEEGVCRHDVFIASGDRWRFRPFSTDSAYGRTEDACIPVRTIGPGNSVMGRRRPISGRGRQSGVSERPG